MALCGIAHPLCGFGECLCWGTDMGNAAIIKVGDAVREVIDTFVVRHHNNHVLGSGGEFTDQPHDHLTRGAIKRTCGLVTHM